MHHPIPAGDPQASIKSKVLDMNSAPQAFKQSETSPGAHGSETGSMQSLLEQYKRLEMELQKAEDDKCAAYDAMDNILLDLDNLQMEFEATRRDAKSKDLEITQLKDEILRLSEQINERDQKIADVQETCDQATIIGRHHLSEIETLRAQIDAEVVLKENALQSAREKLAEQTSASVAQEEGLKNQLAQTPGPVADDEKVLQVSQHDKVVAELQRLLVFYKENGEATSRLARELEATNRDLGALIRGKDQQLLEQKGLIMSLQQQAG